MRHADNKKRKLLLVVLCGIVLLTLLYLGGRWLEMRGYKPGTRGVYQPRHTEEATITYQGASYRPRRGLTSILLMGVGGSTDPEGSMNGGQVDFLQLLVADPAQKSISRLLIDCDTIMSIPVTDESGERTSMRVAQVFRFGGADGSVKESCKLTVKTVSDFLLGVPIDYYFAMNLDDVEALNDQVGGVTVTLEEDLSFLDPEMTKGSTLTLTGEQAALFVRSRVNVSNDADAEWMRRQSAYIEGLFDQTVRLKDEAGNFWDKTFDMVSEHTVTDMNRGLLINEAWKDRTYDLRDPQTLDGEHRIGADGFMQFYADEESLYRNVLGLFFEAC